MILVVPGGDAHTYPISHGIKTFKPYRADKNDPNSLWLVEVPGAVADHLLHNAGFSMYHDESGNSHDGEPPKVSLKHREGLGCGWGGVAYEPDADGVVNVPAAAAADLRWHGFWPIPTVDRVAEEAVPVEVADVSHSVNSVNENEEQYPSRRARRG